MSSLCLDAKTKAYRRIRDVAQVFNGKTPPKSEHRVKGFPVLKIKDLSHDGKFCGSFGSFVDQQFAVNYKDRWVCDKDVLVLNSAHNASHVASKICLANNDVDGALAVGEWSIVRAHQEKILPYYLFCWLKSERGHAALKDEVRGIHLYPKDIASLKITLPPLDEQRRIVEVLERAAGIRRRREQALDKARALIPALFLDMFGDPATNPKGWEIRMLGSVAEVQGGLQVTKRRSSLPHEAPYLRVANVLRDELDLEEVKTIRLTDSELSRTRLVAGDILVVEGHGNANEIGRAAVWDGSIEGCVHQNHLIRVRASSDRLDSDFACAFLNSSSGRRELLRAGKTTSGLNTISTSNVKAVKLLLPPMTMQAAFAERVADIRGIIARQERSLDAARALERSLMARLLG